VHKPFLRYTEIMQHKIFVKCFSSGDCLFSRSDIMKVLLRLNSASMFTLSSGDDTSVYKFTHCQGAKVNFKEHN